MANFGTHFYFSYRGRTGRRLYWLFGVVPGLILGFLVGVVVGALSSLSPASSLLLLFLFLPLLLWMWLAIGVRRLHDVNLSGWWMFAVLLAPAAIAYLLPAALKQLPSLLMMIGLGALPGTKGSNRFGSDPRSRIAEGGSAVDMRSNKSMERTREG